MNPRTGSGVGDLALVVTNRARLVGPLDPDVRRELEAEFTHDNPKFHLAQSLRLPTRGVARFLATWREEQEGDHGSAITFPRGGLDRVRRILAQRGVPFHYAERVEEGAPLNRELESSVVLRDYQERMVRTAIGGRDVLIHGATGCGKTTVGIALAARLGVPVLVIVHTKALLKQWVRRAMAELGLRKSEIGVFGGGTKRLRAITVATHEALAVPGVITREMLGYFGAVIFDEAQRAPAETAFCVIDPFPAAHRVALTADHTRKDGRDVITRDLFGPVALDVSRGELVARGVIHDVEVRFVETDFRADWYEGALDAARVGHPRLRGEADRRLALEIARDEARNELIVRHLRDEVAAGSRAIVLARRREHCTTIDKYLALEGIRSGYMIGGAEQEFEATLAGLASGEVSVGIGTVESLGTGIDMPAVAVGMLVAPLATNKQLLNQVSGRLCRLADGKSGARLYYFWDRAVFGLEHFRNLLKWNPTVRVFQAGEWVDGHAFARGVGLKVRGRAGSSSGRHHKRDTATEDLFDRLRQDSAERKGTTMRGSRPAAPQAPTSTQATAPPRIDPSSAAGIGADASGLCIALKARGHKVPVSDVTNWSEAMRMSAALYAKGELAEVPAHVASYGPEGLNRPAPPPAPQRVARGARPAAPAAPAASPAPPPAPPADTPRTGSGVERPAVPASRSETPLDHDLSAMATRLDGHGFRLLLTDLAEMPTADRRTIAAWLETGALGAIPSVLAPYDKFRAPAPQTALHQAVPAGAPDFEFTGPAVRAVWAEEKITPVVGIFTTATVGPFEVTASVSPGETPIQALRRLNSELVAFAEEERARKINSTLAALEEISIDTKGVRMKVKR